MSERQASRIPFALLALFSTSPAFAEVMDKEPTISGMWASAIVLGAAGAAAWAWNKWAGVVASSLALFFAWGTLLELSDPFVGRDIIREAGPIYVRHTYAAIAASIVPHLGGFLFHLRRRGPVVQVRESA